MNPLEEFVPEQTPLPSVVRAAYAGAELLIDAAAMDAALDQLAVRLTVRYQARAPLLLAEVPGGIYLWSALLQRIVFPCQLGLWPDVDLAGVKMPVVLIGSPGVADTPALQAVLQADPGAEIATVALLRGDGIDFAALEQDCPAGRSLLGCGFDVQGYGANLPALYAIPEEF